MPTQNQPKQTRRKFDREFKNEALRMLAGSQPTVLVARALNISENRSTVGKATRKTKWERKNAHRQTKWSNRIDGPVKAQLKRVKMECDI